MFDKRILGVALAAVLLTPVLGSSAYGFHEDCDTYEDQDAVWGNTVGIDYQDSWESSFGQAPESTISVALSLTCTIRGHSVPNGDLCPLSTCVKFWGQLSLSSGSPGTETAAFCGNLVVNGAPTFRRETPTGNGLLCEYYCSKVYAQCMAGQRVTTTIGITLRYQWEADDALGSDRYTTWQAYNRAGTSYSATHRTCQAGNPVLQIAGGSCGIL